MFGAAPPSLPIEWFTGDDQTEAPKPVTDPSIVRTHVEAAGQVVSAQRGTPFFQRRYRRNIQNPSQHFNKEEFWKQMVVCMCTSDQPSGPNGRLSKFVREKPFPLAARMRDAPRNHARGKGCLVACSPLFRSGASSARSGQESGEPFPRAL